MSAMSAQAGQSHAIQPKKFFRRAGSSVFVTLKEGEEARARAQIEVFKKKWNLDSSSCVAIRRTECARTLKNGNTLKEYERVWRELYLFAIKFGDWRTGALFSSSQRPANPLPANPETIILYWRWKCTKDHLQVQNLDSVDQHWNDGTPMMGCGSWSSPGCLRKSYAAINLMHNQHHFLKGPFERECLQCISYNKNVDFSKGCINSSLVACADHLGSPVLKPRGNVLTCIEVTDQYKHWSVTMAREHIRKGNFQLSPAQIRRIRTNLFGKTVDSLKHQQLYVMMLIGIKLFLRGTEICEIKLGDFPTLHTSVSTKNGGFDVHYISLQVLGKDKTDFTTLRLYRDDSCPEFCPVRHLLAYIECTGISGFESFLFPKWEDLEEHVRTRKDQPGLKKTFTQGVTYDVFLDRLKVS